ncbi:MAG: polymer-forming cytoskeletal protein [Oceanospirillales bacterium]|nr:MAG: polymer-forming cytoskeletal protein [Oceanospirillales bacterium]
MGFREILVIIGILVIAFIIWDASKHIRRSNSDKHHVKVPLLTSIETSKHSELKTEEISFVANLPKDDVPDNDDDNSSLKSTPEPQNFSVNSNATLKDIPLSFDTVPSNELKNKIVTATIGENVQVDGTVKGHEDLLVEGVIKGDVFLENSTITIGVHGKINGDIFARTVYVEGFVKGKIVAAERIALRKSAKMIGNLTSPKLSIEDGARFQGSAFMAQG